MLCPSTSLDKNMFKFWKLGFSDLRNGQKINEFRSLLHSVRNKISSLCMVHDTKSIIQRDVVVMIAFQLDLQLYVQWVPITTKVVSSDPFRRGVLDATLYDTVCQLLAACWWLTLGIPVSSANENDRHDIAVWKVEKE